MAMPFLNTDIPELSGFDTGLCLSNLDVLALRQERVSESVLAMLSELADAIIHDAGGDPDTVDSILLSLQSISDGDDGEEREDTPVNQALSRIAPVNRDPILRMTARAGLYARLMLYRLVEEKLPSSAGKPPTAALSSTAKGRIAYMPSAFADKAYLHLAATVKSPRATATASFVDACEEVHSGLCEYCILPLENSHSGRLPAFTRLILRYRLQVVTVRDLENGAVGGQITRFALLRNATDGIPTAPLHPVAHGEPLYLELIHTVESLPLSDLLIAAEFCGLTLCRADTLPRFDELESVSKEGPAAVACVLNATEGDLTTFRRFLSLEASEDILVGLYGSL